MLRNINWFVPTSQVTDHFTVKDCTYLPSWGIYHQTSDDERRALLELCVVMEKIRALLGNNPISVNCCIRPNKVNCPSSPHHGQDYNAAVGSTAKHSAHIFGMACDFTVGHLTCDQARAALLPHLDELKIRMEDKPGSTWVHVDCFDPSVSGGRRYFVP